jgi:hypothetical protein
MQLHATGTYSDGTTKDLTTQVLWASSDTDVASIDSTGFVTAKRTIGRTTINAILGSIVGTTTLTVQ